MACILDFLPQCGYCLKPLTCIIPPRAPGTQTHHPLRKQRNQSLTASSESRLRQKAFQMVPYPPSPPVESPCSHRLLRAHHFYAVSSDALILWLIQYRTDQWRKGCNITVSLLRSGILLSRDRARKMLPCCSQLPWPRLYTREIFGRCTLGSNVDTSNHQHCRRRDIPPCTGASLPNRG